MSKFNGETTRYLLQQEIQPDESILYRIKEKDVLNPYPFMSKDNFRPTILHSSVESYKHIRQLNILLPCAIRQRRIGQYVNPTKLLKEHWALENTRRKHCGV